ncbi:lamin tail domain-containing protein [Catellatospora sichuanensis]|uniref:lamin tail domain-containing protein n=1 Tax=Catellatospora sichuanensis TaxID=1969805 RepID=UPI001183BD94|nr:lamin tail domain-containing protein [Catellatospora sichuanensis]
MRQWVRRVASAAVVSLSAGVAGLFLPVPALAVSPDIVISQVYGGGGNIGATYTNDFIELFNRGPAQVDVSGWSVQYASAGGNSWQTTPLTGVIMPGAYYLVQQAQGNAGTTPLPAPNVADNIAMNATAGKVALVTNQTTLTCGTGCATLAGVRDFVGYGPTASSYEGAGRAPLLSNSSAALRDDAGAADTDDNSVDFTVAAPNPRNSPPVVGVADLVVTKSDSPDPVTAGQQITYTVTVTNEGPDDAQAVEMTDTLPAGTTFVSATVSSAGWTLDTPAVGSGGTVTADAATLADGAQVTFTITVLVAAGATGTITNTATAGSDSTDPDSDNNSAATTTTVRQPSANLAITKTDFPDPVVPGATLTYTISVGNSGPDAAQSVVMRDEIPANTTFVSFTAAAGWALGTVPPVGGTGEVTATRAVVAAGDPVAVFTLVVKVDATATGRISNRSSITSATSDPDVMNNTAIADTDIGPTTPLCTITGTARTDIINGTLGDDVICGLGGNDIINGKGGNDIIYGGPGTDLLSGGKGDDMVYGEAGNDLIKIDDKVSGNDNADGGPGFDLCSADPLDAVLSCP